MKGYSSEELQNSSSGTRDKGSMSKLLMPSTRGERAVVGHTHRGELAKVEDGGMRHGGMIGSHGSMSKMKHGMKM